MMESIHQKYTKSSISKEMYRVGGRLVICVFLLWIAISVIAILFSVLGVEVDLASKAF